MRKLRTIRRDGRGVSPVIATILMVAITVVLAAVLYMMVAIMIPPERPSGIQVTFSPGGQGPDGWRTVVAGVSQTESLEQFEVLVGTRLTPASR
jgi:flagellin-like protein